MPAQTMIELDNGRVKLYCEDCFDLMKAFDDKMMDVTITDPPYDERTHSGAISGQSNGVKSNDIDFVNIDQSQIACMVKEFLRLSKRWCLAFCTFEDIGKYADEARKTEAWVRAGVWDRINPAPQFTGDRPSQAADGIAIWHSKVLKKHWNGGGQQGIWRCSVEFGNKEHPTQKPVKLMDKLVYQFSDDDEVVFDPFMGSGTTGVSAIKLGRRFIGIEKNERYFEVALKRIKQAISQPSLFNV